MTEAVTNDEQIAYWNEKAGPKWVAYQEKLDAQIAPFAEEVLDRVGLRAGERVLDVGCGCGATTLAAAERVGAGGGATGVDISRPMLARARERAAAMGLNQATFVEGDAQTYAFEAGVFDAVISRFGVMFFSDPATALANIRRALEKGGRLTFMCWRPLKENPWAAVPLMAAAQHVEMPPPPEPHAPGPFGLADGERTKRVLESAGYAEVSVEPYDRPMPIGNAGTLEEAVEFSMNLGPVSAVLVDKPDDVRAAVREALGAALAPYHGARGVELDSAAWLVSARNP